MKFKTTTLIAITGITFLFLCLFVGCNSKPDEVSKTHDSSNEYQSFLTERANGNAVHKGKTYKVAMTAAFVSENGAEIYAEIVEYLNRKSDLSFEFVTGFSYKTVNDMLASGDLDIGFVCGLPYVLLRDSKVVPPVQLLVAPVMSDPRYQDQPIYFSEIIVHKDSPYHEFSDLKGRTFVYNDEISNSGYNLPRFHFIQAGETKGFFGKVIRSGSHEESIRMIAEKNADVSAVDSLVLDYDRTFFPKYASQVRVIKSLGPAGIPPVVVSSEVPEEISEKIKEILTAMHLDPEGKKILNKVLIKRFETVNEKNYESIWKMYQTAKDTQYLEIK